MPTVSCPACSTEYPFQPQLAGKKTRCANCKHVFAFPSAVAEAPSLPASVVPPAPSPLQPLKMAPAAEVPALRPLAAPSQVSNGLWDDVPALMPTEERSAPFSFSTNAAPIYRGETRGASLSCGHVPPQFGEVVMQTYYRTPAWRAILGVIGLIAAAVLLVIIGQFVPEKVGNVTYFYFFYDCVPAILAFFTVFIAVTSIIDHVRPRVIAVTRLGIYLPAAAYWWGMRFVPYSAQTRWGNEIKVTAGGSYPILAIYSDVGNYQIVKEMFPDKDTYEEFVDTLHQIFPGRL